MTMVDRLRGQAAGILASLLAGGALVHPAAAHGADGARASVRAAIRRAGATYADLERKEVERLGQSLDRLRAEPGLVGPFLARDRKALLAAAKPTFERLRADGVTHWYFHDAEPARTCFLRVHAPTLSGDVIDRATLSQAIATHEVGFGKELGKTAFALRVVKPIVSGGRTVGYMELGEEIDHFFTRMKAQTGDDFALLVDKARVDRKELARVLREDRWNERPDVVVIDSTMWNEKNVELGVPLSRMGEDEIVVREWKDGSASFAGGAFPVRDAAKQIVGAVFVRHQIL
jgi:hypothetical protein